MALGLLLKRLACVLVPSLMALVPDVLAPRLLFRHQISPTNYFLMKYGSLVVLILAAAWLGARFCRLGARSAALVGLSVFVASQLLPLALLQLLRPDLDPSPSPTEHPVVLALGVLVLCLLALLIGYSGAWLGVRMRPGGAARGETGTRPMVGPGHLH